VNRDWLAFGGRHVGMPHKVADVQMTRFHPADPIYDGPKEGVRIAVSVDCVGHVLRAHCDLERKLHVNDTPLPYGTDKPPPKYLGRRYFWGVYEERPLVNDLFAHWPHNLQFGPVWGGPAEVTFFDAENEEVLPFQPRRVLGGWFFTILYSRTAKTEMVIHRYDD
jgi:hypothetical protein